MVCQACGVAIGEGVHFCPRCGAQVVAAQPMYGAYPPAQMYRPVPRVHRNLQLLGILWCAFGALRLLGGLMAVFFVKMIWFRRFGDNWQFGRHGQFGPFGPEFMTALLPVMMVVAVLASALALLVGYALLTRRPWGRVLAIIVAVLSLFKIPFGTALGIYTLWVLAPESSGREYEEMAGVGGRVNAARYSA
jgi:hypothetical protein